MSKYIVTKKKSFGLTICTYYTTNVKLYEEFGSSTPLMYCGVDIEAFNDMQSLQCELEKWI